MSRNTVKATCIVEVEVECSGCWSEDTTMQQIVKQASDGARGRIDRLFADASNNDGHLPTIRKGANGLSLRGIKNIEVRVIHEN